MCVRQTDTLTYIIGVGTGGPGGPGPPNDYPATSVKHMQSSYWSIDKFVGFGPPNIFYLPTPLYIHKPSTVTLAAHAH